MRNLIVSVLLLATAVHTFAAPGRTIKSLPNFPLASLRHGVSKPLFRSLEVSPIEAWIVAITTLSTGKAGGAKIIHSEANGQYDKMLLDLANDYSVSGTNTIESRLVRDTLTVHLLIYKIADGAMAVCFSHSDDAGYIGYEQTGQAWVGVLKNGKWQTISKPQRLP